jgi:hypothetical protein
VRWGVAQQVVTAPCIQQSYGSKSIHNLALSLLTVSERTRGSCNGSGGELRADGCELYVTALVHVIDCKSVETRV